MRNLIEGIIKFRQNSRESYCRKFAKLAEGQSPDTMLISCCDSRVVPNIFTSEDPGHMFILRNIGNLVPPYQTKSDSSVAAALEYSIFELDIENIIICGHSGCGAMAASLEKKLPPNHEAIEKWLEYVKPSQQKMQQDFMIDPNLTPQNRLSQINVVQQLEHLKTYPYVTERLQEGSIKIHGWWFELATADVYSYEQKDNKFNLIKAK